MTFDEFFREATGTEPFPYQRRLARGESWPSRLEVPTGLGKTLAVLTAWLWRRREESGRRPDTPRRLVYCLPMRVLVEQSQEVAAGLLRRCSPHTQLVVLMGGADDSGDWDIYPERDTIIIGTQDMLLSRALNRGYGMSRFRWPLHFGLLNNDCLWIIDEVQLVGAGVATTAQLQGLRGKLGTAHPTHTCWMSATLQPGWLQTVDLPEAALSEQVRLGPDDLAHPVVASRIHARKAVRRTASMMGDPNGLAAEVLDAHEDGARTLVVLNTVDRATKLFERVRKLRKSAVELVLVHSRFRPHDRAAALERALAAPGPAGTIVISTQVVEAGVDFSARTLITEVAPWASLVQRFGRCNRRGDDPNARVLWVGLPSSEKERAKLAPPYGLAELVGAQQLLGNLQDAGPGALPKAEYQLERGQVLRRRDLIDLFDTTSDLMGNDVDVSRFIREADDLDVRLFWRDFAEEPPAEERSPGSDELCSASVGFLRRWLKKKEAWTWDPLRGEWSALAENRVRPGLTVLLRSRDGGYETVLGLNEQSKAAVKPVESPAPENEDRAYDGDPESELGQWYTLAAHSSDVAAEAKLLGETLLDPSLRADLIEAARWHDAGKAHRVWQDAARRLGENPPDEPVAKTQSPRGRLRFKERPGFRHELASALAALQAGKSDLCCYLVASHHGKVRLSLRALPNERPPVVDGRPDPRRRHARGVWEGDELPAVDLGDGVISPGCHLSLACMEMGEDDTGAASWTARVLALRDGEALGPFRLAWLEALIKCADERASIRVRGTGRKHAG